MILALFAMNSIVGSKQIKNERFGQNPEGKNRLRHLKKIGDSGVDTDTNLATSLKNTYYTLGFSIFQLVGGVFFLFFQIYLMRIFLTFNSFALSIMVVLSIVSTVEYRTNTHGYFLIWEIISIVIGLALGSIAFFYPLFALSCSGILALRSLIVFLGHCQGIFEKLRYEGIYGHESIVLIVCTWILSIVGVFYGNETYIRQSQLINPYRAVQFRDILLSLSISYIISDSSFLLFSHPMIFTQTEKQGYRMQIYYCTIYILTVALSLILLKYALLDVIPVFPYRNIQNSGNNDAHPAQIDPSNEGDDGDNGNDEYDNFMYKTKARSTEDLDEITTKSSEGNSAVNGDEIEGFEFKEQNRLQEDFYNDQQQQEKNNQAIKACKDIARDLNHYLTILHTLQTKNQNKLEEVIELSCEEGFTDTSIGLKVDGADISQSEVSPCRQIELK